MSCVRGSPSLARESLPSHRRAGLSYTKTRTRHSLSANGPSKPRETTHLLREDGPLEVSVDMLTKSMVGIRATSRQSAQASCLQSFPTYLTTIDLIKSLWIFRTHLTI